MSGPGGEAFSELLRRRRMVRSYLPDPIDRETIERIVGTVRRAPSAGFSLPDDVHFTCVVTIGRQPPDVDDSPLVSRLTQARKPLDELVRWERWQP